jgi:hypothetical protein
VYSREGEMAVMGKEAIGQEGEEGELDFFERGGPRLWACSAGCRFSTSCCNS